MHSQTFERPIFTIGHSTRSFPEFAAMLTAHGVTHLVDVRTVPRSRQNPQFNKETLPTSLRTFKIGYSHVPALGGLRKPRPNSRNLAWRNRSFRGYADHMETDAFQEAVEALVERSRTEQLALMCAEAVPWRCHRSLIGDALTARGVSVEEIVSVAKRAAHRMTPFASISGLQVTYPDLLPPD